jgi:hypothetical protein
VKRVARYAGFAFIVCAVGQGFTALAQTGLTGADITTLPIGTRIELAVTAPVWARTAKAGDALYTQVDFPVITGSVIAIPAGTYVQGTIQSISRPSRFKGRAQIQALFTTVIFANGYVVSLPRLYASTGPTQTVANPLQTSGALSPLSPTVMDLTVNVSSSNDLLLDNGTQFDMTLAAPLSLDSRQVAAAVPLSRTVDLGKFKSATQCRPTPGTPGSPGTPDTVIPGSPGTPSTTIPGGPGMPDIVIPGTPSTPPTVIPGTPGTPGFSGQNCPPPPIVTSSVAIPYNSVHNQGSSSANNH